MPKNKIEDLRNHLFIALEKLNDEEPISKDEMERIKAIAEVSQVIVNSAKIENDYLKITKAQSSGFINSKQIEHHGDQ